MVPHASRARPNPNLLCCCEYIDKDGERNHILACCCNCVELDSAVDSFCCCRNRSKKSCSRILQVVEDRMRVPWVGGAKQVTLDAVLPVLLVPLIFLLSAQGPLYTGITFLVAPLFIYHLHSRYLQYVVQTRFYIVWTYTSFALIFLIYEIEVVPFLEINVDENRWFIALFGAAVFFLYKVKRLNGIALQQVDEESVGSSLPGKEAGSDICSSCGIYVPSRTGHCRICQLCIPKRELHCLWFGCCIGSHNLLWFLLCLLSLTAASIYSASLILTTVCRPVRFWGPIYMPEDCSEVYVELRYAVCFVSGLYALQMSVPMVWALIRHSWMITLGVTGTEWRSMPLIHKCRLGITANRPYSRGPFRNWFDLLTCRHRKL